jgi:predicted RNA-binding Zn-ribbon protein involved in translation (DUF1610 family)
MRRIGISLLALTVLLSWMSVAVADTPVVCNNCGKTFNVPDDYYEFACPYCGYEYDTWTCSVCGVENFVPLDWDDWSCWNCGQTYEGWICWNCDAYNFVPAENDGFYCTECGKWNSK